MPRGGKTRTSGQGRKKGVPNKLTRVLKDMILGALDDAGGQAYLAEQARKNPSAFLSLLGRLVPQELKGELTGKDGALLPSAVTIYLPANGRDG